MTEERACANNTPVSSPPPIDLNELCARCGRIVDLLGGLDVLIWSAPLGISDDALDQERDAQFAIPALVVTIKGLAKGLLTDIDRMAFRGEEADSGISARDEG